MEVLWGEVIHRDAYCLLRHENRRQRIRRAHTATHLLHSVLRGLFGDTIRQAGSLVEEDKLRFDFNHSRSISFEDLLQIEKDISLKILNNDPVHIKTMSLEQSKKKTSDGFF